MEYRVKKNPLKVYFENNKGRKIDKWMHYFDAYDRHLTRFRKKKITVVEFGVQNGGSLQMWRKYFGKKARYIGVDIDPRCKILEKDGFEIYIGDQEDRNFLKMLTKVIGKIDVLIDDGGHTMGQQIATFEELYPYVAETGVFLVEDTHTSYWKRFDAGYKQKHTFMEYTKNLVDEINAWHSETSKLKVTDFTKTTRSITFYDSIVVFEKGNSHKAPVRRQTGEASF